MQKFSVTAVAGAAALLAATVQAQETITVTGNGRAQQLQQVPIALQLVNAEQIDRLAADNIAALDGYLPGLQVNADQATQPIFTLRGIGTSDFGIGTDAPVGIYVDGVYTGKTGGALMNFNDVKRVEVLKGPQGTLFGRNSAGGAISIVTNDPTSTFAARGVLRAGSWGTRQLEAMVNQPLSDDWALRLAATVHKSDGWQRDANTGRQERGDDAWGTRLSLGGGLGNATRVVLSWEHEKLDQRALPSIGLVDPPAFGADPATWRDPRTAPLTNDAIGNGEQRRFDGVTLRIDSSIAGLDFTSTTAWRRFDAFNRTDNDGTALADHYLSTGNVERNATWQQEFRLAARSKAVDWLAGLSLFAESARQTSEVASNTSALDTLYGNLAGVAPFATVTQLAGLAGVPGIDLAGLPWQEEMRNEARNRAFALYGDAIWHLTPQTNLTTGLRFTRDRKRFSWFAPPRSAGALDEQLAVLDAVQLLPGLVQAGLLGAEDAAQLQALLSSNQLIAGTTPVATAPLQVDARWNNWSPRVVLDHRFDEGLMVYASVTRGYQAGGFNALQVNGRYEPETVTSWELGAKGEWRAQGLAYAVSLFRYRFDNLQSLTLVPASDQTAVPSYQVTISDQRATGMDLDLRWQPTAALRLFGGAEFISQRYRRHTGLDGSDLSGQPVGTPLWTATLGAEWRFALAGGQASASLQGAYTGATRCNGDSFALGTCVDVPAFRVGEARTRLDTRIGWDSAAGSGPRWGVALVVNNLADRRTVNLVNHIADGLGSPYAVIGAPRRTLLELHATL